MEEDDDIIVFKGRRIPIGDSAIDLKKDADSTVAALCFPELLNRAVYVRSDIPKPGNQRKGFKFDVIYELHAKYAQGKTAKVIVGARKSGLHVQYCITALKL